MTTTSITITQSTTKSTKLIATNTLEDQWEIDPIYCFGHYFDKDKFEKLRASFQELVKMNRISMVIGFQMLSRAQIHPYPLLNPCAHRYLRLDNPKHRLLIYDTVTGKPTTANGRKWSAIPGMSNWINRHSEPVSGYLIDVTDSPPGTTWPLDPDWCQTLCQYRIGLKGTDDNGRWFIAYKSRERIDETCYQIIPAPKGRFYADPFVWNDWIFFEDADIETGHGHISCLQLPIANDQPPPRTVLKQSYHLSFPFIFQQPNDDALYMIPESHQNRTIELYRCLHFPDQWELDTVLVDEINAADTVYLYWAGKHWLFTGLQSPGIPGPPHPLLAIFYADNLRGPWHRHSYQPVNPGQQMSRPAGKILINPTNTIQLLRPAQDNRNWVYGYQLLFYQITKLTPEEYEEKLVTILPPTWTTECPLYRTHTFNMNDRYWVVDGYTDRNIL